MSTLPITTDPKQIAAMAPHALDPQCVEAIVERKESHDAMVKRLARDRLKAKLSALSPADIVSGLHSVIERKHGALLRAAFAESAEAFGDALMTIVVREMELQSEIEAAQIAMLLEGVEAEPKPLHRFIRIVGDC